MPVNRESKILLVHIPKNAGTSVAKLINSYPNHGHRLNHEFLYGIREDGLVLQSIPLSYYKEYIEDLNEYFIVTVTRNPYDRIISDYSWDNRGFSTIKEYIEWVDEILNINDWDELLKFNKYHTNHILPQCYYLNEEGLDLREKIHIFKLENLFEDIKVLEDRVDGVLPHINKSNRTKTIESLSKDEKELIYKIYYKDFKKFGYEK